MSEKKSLSPFGVALCAFGLPALILLAIFIFLQLDMGKQGRATRLPKLSPPFEKLVLGSEVDIEIDTLINGDTPEDEPIPVHYRMKIALDGHACVGGYENVLDNTSGNVMLIPIPGPHYMFSFHRLVDGENIQDQFEGDILLRTHGYYVKNLMRKK